MSQLKIDLVLNKLQAMTGLRSFESNVMSIGKRLAGFVGIGGGIAGITATIQGLLDKASRLQDVSDAFNVSAESIQRLGNAGLTANLSIEEVGSKLGKLGKAAQEAANDTGGELAQAFAKIGVSASELNTLTPDQLFDRLREAVQSGKLAGEELSVVNKLLAKDYQRWLPLLRMTREEFNQLAEAGGIMSEATVTSLDAANVQIKMFQERISNFTAEAAASIISLYQILKKDPKLGLELITASDFSAVDKLSAKYEELQKSIKDRISAERKQRRGDPSADEPTVAQAKKDDLEQDQLRTRKELQTAEERYAEALRQREMASQDANEKIGRTQAELIALQSDAAMLADSTAAKYEKLAEIEAKRLEIMGLQNDAASEAKRLADEQARAAERLNNIRSDIESIIAQREGPQAEFELQKQRATAAAEAARQEATPENILAAQQEALRLQQMQESRLDRIGFGEQSASRARGFVDQTVGAIPGMEALRDIQRATDMKAQEIQKVQLAAVPGLPEVVGKLDELIRTAGRFN
jgi:hypothetical protein